MPQPPSGLVLLSGAFERRGSVTSQNNFVFFLLIILRWFYLFFQSSKTILNHLEIISKIIFEVRDVFLSNSGTLPNILFYLQPFRFFFGGVGSVKGNYFEVG